MSRGCWVESADDVCWLMKMGLPATCAAKPRLTASHRNKENLVAAMLALHRCLRSRSRMLAGPGLGLSSEYYVGGGERDRQYGSAPNLMNSTTNPAPCLGLAQRRFAEQRRLCDTVQKL